MNTWVVRPPTLVCNITATDQGPLQETLLDFQISEAEALAITAVQKKGRSLLEVFGDCGHDTLAS